MSDPLKPSASLLAKLGSIAVHADEMLSPDGHAFDRTAIQGLLVDVEVDDWIREMDKQAFLPVKRLKGERLKNAHAIAALTAPPGDLSHEIRDEIARTRPISREMLEGLAAANLELEADPGAGRVEGKSATKCGIKTR